MTTSAPVRERHGGANAGSPVGVRAEPVREFRLGLLPQPNIFERLRGSLSVAAVLPHIDPSALRTREWRAAAVMTLATHVVVLGLVVLLGWLALSRITSDADEGGEYRLLGKLAPGQHPETPGNTGSERRGDPTPSAGGKGGGKQEPAPASPGTPPRTAPVQPIIPPTPTQPILTPVLPVPETTFGPHSLAIAQTTPTGLPNALPAPPSSGPGKGGGIGTGEGSDVGGRTGGGDGGIDGSGRSGSGGPSGRRDGTADAADAGQGGPAGGGAPITRDAKLMHRVAARIPQAMLDAGTFGTVRLSVVIGPDGKVRSVTPVQPLPNGGTQAAINALYKCTFRPALKDGVPVVSEPLLIKFEMRAGG
jgi:hypothetical protein